MAILVGCNGGGQQIPPAATSPAPVEPSVQPTPTPSTTPSPSVLWVLGLPGGEHPVDPDTLISAVSAMGASQGLTVEQASDPANIPAETLAAILAIGPGGVPDIVSQFPDKPILLVTTGPVEEAGQAVFNLYYPDLALERQAMLAGYSAALITRDWRVAALTAPAEERLRESILQGAIYMCGLCRPTLPPYASYPLTFNLEPAAGPGQLDNVAAEMSQLGVETVVLSPSLVRAEIVTRLAEHGIQVIGMGSMEEPLSDAWAATIQYSFEIALAEIWPAYIAGEPPRTGLIPLQITDRNPLRFTDARLRLAEQAAQEISVGTISPIP